MENKTKPKWEYRIQQHHGHLIIVRFHEKISRSGRASIMDCQVLVPVGPEEAPTDEYAWVDAKEEAEIPAPGYSWKIRGYTEDG